MAGKVSTVEQVIARLASRSHGVVTRQRLIAAGVTGHEVDKRLAIGALLPVHRGVYRVGHRAPSIEARYLAAVLACGDGALLSGKAAAHLWGLTKGPAPPPEVTAPTWRRVPGVATRRSRLAAGATHRGIPITTVPFTLIALAAHLPSEELARACHEAGVRYDTTPQQVDAILRPNAPGAKKLRAVLHGDTKVTVSKLERRFLELLRETKAYPSPAPTAKPAPAASTAAGPHTASPSSSMATATTAPATPGNGTAGVSVRRTREATTSAATPTATSSSNPRSCSPSCADS